MIKIAIIGAGPAGLLAAIAAGDRAEVFESNLYSGRKLLLSGSGQCNFTNDLPLEDFLLNCRESRNFLKPALYEFDNHAFIDLLNSNGCPTLVREDGKVFPASFHSADVRDTLLRLALGKGAKFHYGKKLDTIRLSPDGDYQLSFSDGDILTARKLILANGGMSYPETGSDGSGFRLAKALKHKITPPKPALCGIELKNHTVFSSCSGISLKNVHFCYCGPNGRIETYGDILFTHKGVSGPVVLNNSYHLHAGSALGIRFVEDADSKIPELLKLHAKKNLANLLKHLDLPENLIDAILIHLKLDPGLQASQLKAADRNLLIAYLTTAVFQVKSLDGFDTAMATAGGIELSRVRPQTMESRVRHGLYFAGEILDYNLPTGGYNIQAAASTGWLSGKSAAKALEEQAQD
ncbi:MAG TPA: aminoacetone oxidase family FAD-binding enzyme [Candidatus Cloacimonadota bacterium]|nr:aminoacetone oxidase family FAD-binding enzyme [Candidatus Cloacimonadota bacterium]HPS39431.1 aminoacetone oxidase family FAD-binding enzyme [Candidatus Cloacimonadota bacterium]